MAETSERHDRAQSTKIEYIQSEFTKSEREGAQEHFPE